MQEFVGLDKDCVQGVVRLNPFSKTCHEDLLSSSILMLKNGSLFLIWKQVTILEWPSLTYKSLEGWMVGIKDCR